MKKTETEIRLRAELVAAYSLLAEAIPYAVDALASGAEKDPFKHWCFWTSFITLHDECEVNSGTLSGPFSPSIDLLRGIGANSDVPTGSPFDERSEELRDIGPSAETSTEVEGESLAPSTIHHVFD